MKTTLKTKTSTLGLMALLVSLSGCLTNKETKVVQVPTASGPQPTASGPSTAGPAGPLIAPAAPAGGGTTPAAQGPITDGGGNITNQGEVFDVVEDRGLTEIDLKQEPFYAKVLVHKFAEWNRILLAARDVSMQIYMPALSSPEDFYPFLKLACDQMGFEPSEWQRCKKDFFLGVRLGDLLRSRLASRKWYLEDGEIGAAGCVNRSMIAIEREIAACQDDYEVRISRKAWTKMDDANKAALVTHELLLTMARQSSNYGSQKEVSERAVRVVNRLLQTGAPIHTVQREMSMRFSSLFPMRMWGEFVYDKGVEMVDRWFALLERKACESDPVAKAGDLLADSILEIEKAEGLDPGYPTGQAYIDQMKRIEASYGKDIRSVVTSMIRNDYGMLNFPAPIGGEKISDEEMRKIDGFFGSMNAARLCKHFRRPSP